MYTSLSVNLVQNDNLARQELHLPKPGCGIDAQLPQSYVPRRRIQAPSIARLENCMDGCAQTWMYIVASTLHFKPADPLILAAMRKCTTCERIKKLRNKKFSQ